MKLRAVFKNHATYLYTFRSQYGIVRGKLGGGGGGGGGGLPLHSPDWVVSNQWDGQWTGRWNGLWNGSVGSKIH